ncbi:hypothetical protein LN42_01810 [Marinitoga sp. 1137]|uniref:hypothetical protein n=1 Tax=Marinitoga sp. 1137 TaxID=1545835 RepID=UPI0009506062|nr:hypothetical protein [Marinitoga sp. 1137]APT75267.1 hypothetical protein LN42_01810 [Marinitoga sp. 1137]
MNVYPEEFKKLCKKVIEDEKFHELVDANAYIVGRYLDDYSYSNKPIMHVDKIINASSFDALKKEALKLKERAETFSKLYKWWKEIVKEWD